MRTEAEVRGMIDVLERTEKATDGKVDFTIARLWLEWILNERPQHDAKGEA